MLEQIDSQYGIKNTRYVVHAVPYYLDDATNVEGKTDFPSALLPPLNDQQIIEFEVFQKMNEFMRIGHLTYLDTEQKLDSLFGKTLAGIRVFVT